jgi:hypothetical protein
MIKITDFKQFEALDDREKDAIIEIGKGTKPDYFRTITESEYKFYNPNGFSETWLSPPVTRDTLYRIPSYKTIEGIKAIKEAMIAKGYEWEASYHKEFMGKPNQYYFAFTKGTHSFAYWSEIEEETIVQAAMKALLSR